MSAPGTGDALLLALAAEYRAANAAVLAFDDEENVWTGVMATYLAGVRDNHDHRRDSLAEAIAAVKADGFPGAMVQLEILAKINDAGEPCDHYREIHRDHMRDALVWSIAGVVAKAAGSAAPEGLGFLEGHQDAFRADLPTLMAEWRVRFDAAGLDYAEKPRSRRPRPKVPA